MENEDILRELDALLNEATPAGYDPARPSLESRATALTPQRPSAVHTATQTAASAAKSANKTAVFTATPTSATAETTRRSIPRVGTSVQRSDQAQRKKIEGLLAVPPPLRPVPRRREEPPRPTLQPVRDLRRHHRFRWKSHRA